MKMMITAPTIIFNHENYQAPDFSLKILIDVTRIYGAFKMDDDFMYKLDERTKRQNKYRFFVWF